MKNLVLSVALVFMVSNSPLSGSSSTEPLLNESGAQRIRPPHYEHAILGVDRSLAARALEGDGAVSSQILRSLSPTGSENPTIDEYRRQFFWLEIDAQNGNMESIMELATHSGGSLPYFCQRGKYWASVAVRQFPQYEKVLEDRANPDQAALVEQTIHLRRIALADTLQRSCIGL